jgi:thiaminase
VNSPNKIPQLQIAIDYWADRSYAASIDLTGDIINEWYEEDATSKRLGFAEKVFIETLDAEDAFWRSVDAWSS